MGESGLQDMSKACFRNLLVDYSNFAVYVGAKARTQGHPNLSDRATDAEATKSAVRDFKDKKNSGRSLESHFTRRSVVGLCVLY